MEKAYLNSPVGILEIVENDGICEINFVSNFIKSSPKNPNLKLCLYELEQYFLGNLKIFTTKLNLQGTKFQLKIYEKLSQIPYASTKTYQDLAILAGHKNAQRATGSALGKNKIPIILPCHRVISKNGLGGYTGGTDIKIFLLELEAKFSNKCNKKFYRFDLKL